jgi:hypothetical protein
MRLTPKQSATQYNDRTSALSRSKRRCKGYRSPPDITSYAVRLYYRFPLCLPMVEQMLAARRIELTCETEQCRATKFGLAIARRIRSTSPGRAVDQHGAARCISAAPPRQGGQTTDQITTDCPDKRS